MGIKSAWEIMTNPNPTNRDILVMFLAERIKKRFGYRGTLNVKEQDVWWLLLVLARWGWFTQKERYSMSRHALGDIVRDVCDVCRLERTENT